MTIAFASIAGCAQVAAGADVAARAALMPDVQLDVGGGPPQLMVLAGGRLSPPEHFAFLTLRWPLPEGLAERDVALAVSSGAAVGEASDADRLLARKADAAADGEEKNALESARELVVESDGPAIFAASEERPEPSIRAIQRAAVRHAGLDPEALRSLGGRARVAALLPEVGVMLDRTVRREDSLLASELSGDRLDLLAGEGYAYQVRALWHLDRIVYDPSELRIAASAARFAHERAALLARVTALYFERQRLDREEQAGPPDPDRALRIAELGANLDGLCGGCLHGTN